MKKFELGRVVATPGAVEALRAAGQSPESLLRLHMQGDWGDLNTHDRARQRRRPDRGGAPPEQLPDLRRGEALDHHGSRPFIDLHSAPQRVLRELRP